MAAHTTLSPPLSHPHYGYTHHALSSSLSPTLWLLTPCSIPPLSLSHSLPLSLSHSHALFFLQPFIFKEICVFPDQRLLRRLNVVAVVVVVVVDYLSFKFFIYMYNYISMIKKFFFKF
jgi:hypothetical protein